MYVNQELFIALKELASEGRIDSDKVSVIIQTNFYIKIFCGFVVHQFVMNVKISLKK